MIARALTGLGVLLACVLGLCGAANAQAGPGAAYMYCESVAGPPAQFAPCNSGNPLAVNATVSASITGFQPAGSPATPITATTGGATGTLPTSQPVVIVTNVGTTNGAYCALGASATTSSQYIAPGGGWFAFTVGAATQITCITSSSTTTINVVGGSGLPTGAGGALAATGSNAAASATGSAVPSSASYDGLNVAGTLRGQTGVNPSGSIYAAQTDLSSVGGASLAFGSAVSASSIPVVVASDQAAIAVKAASGSVASGAVASGAIAAGAVSAGAYVSGSVLSGAFASGALVDITNLSAASTQNVAAPSKGALVLGQFNTTPTTISTGNVSALQLDAAGNLLVNIKAGAGSGGTALADGATFTIGTTSETPAACTFVTGGITITTGKSSVLTCTAAGSLHTTVDNTNSNGQAAIASSSPVAVARNSGTGSTIAGSVPGTAGSASADVISVQGVASGTPLASNTAQVNGVTVLTGTGATGTGAQRVTVSTDQATNAGAALVKGGVGVVNGGSRYQAVAASATATVLQSSTGAAGDYLSHCVIYPQSTSPGVVTVFDGSNSAPNSAILFAGGASSLSNLAPIPMPVGAISRNGAWEVTTGANVSVVCYGSFS